MHKLVTCGNVSTARLRAIISGLIFSCQPTRGCEPQSDSLSLLRSESIYRVHQPFHRGAADRWNDHRFRLHRLVGAFCHLPGLDAINAIRHSHRSTSAPHSSIRPRRYLYPTPCSHASRMCWAFLVLPSTICHLDVRHDACDLTRNWHYQTGVPKSATCMSVHFDSPYLTNYGSPDAGSWTVGILRSQRTLVHLHKDIGTTCDVSP